MTAVLSLLSYVYTRRYFILNTWLSQRVGFFFFFFPKKKRGGDTINIYVSLLPERKKKKFNSAHVIRRYFQSFRVKIFPTPFSFLKKEKKKEKMIMYTKWPFCRVVYVVSCRITLSYLFPQKKKRTKSGGFLALILWCFNLFFSVSNIFFEHDFSIHVIVRCSRCCCSSSSCWRRFQKAVIKKARVTCKCHGVSGSCKTNYD